MQIIDLFSGVGGFSIAGHQLGWETILFCEKEPFPQMVLRERFPGVPIFDDVCKLTGEKINGLIQSDRPIILTGGFPCQPFSVAGAREGTEDDRHLWPEMFRIIQAVRPDYIIGENVPGLLSIEGGVVFEQVCLDLESEGYEVQAFVLPACATGAPHRRDRVWIVAHSNEVRRGSGLGSVSKKNGEVPEWNENAEFGNTNSGTTSDTTSNGHSGRYSETGGEKRESEQRGLLKSTGADSGTNSNSKHNGPLAEQELRSNETPSDQWGQEEQNASKQSSGTDRPIDATGIHGSENGSEQCTSENPGSSGCNDGEYEQQGSIGNFRELGTGGNEWDINAEINSNTSIQGHKRSEQPRTYGEGFQSRKPHKSTTELHSGNYWHDWPSISPFHFGHDGLSPELVRHIRTSLAEAGETPENIEAYIRKESNYIRKEAIKCAGNAVVPTVVLQIMKAIQYHYENTND